MLYPIGFRVCWPRSQGMTPMTRRGCDALVINSGRVGLIGLAYAFVFVSGFRKAASPASDTSTHFGSGEALAA
jgi:hypothetical protein